MKKILEILRKICKCRVLWAVLGIVWVLYFGLALFGGLYGMQKILIYYDAAFLLLLLCVVILVLYLAGMEKDFFRGFYRAFAGKGKGVSWMELRRAVKAFECAEKTTVIGAVMIYMLGFTDMLTSMSAPRWDSMELFWTVLSSLLAYLCGHVVYTAGFLLVLLPVKVRLDRMLISYMEESENSRTEADGQRIYFGLRAMGLTDREAEVARLAESGMSNREIGKQLYIAEGTVKKHMTHILEKMHCANREELTERVKKL